VQRFLNDLKSSKTIIRLRIGPGNTFKQKEVDLSSQRRFLAVKKRPKMLIFAIIVDQMPRAK
jgi:hypothetical protein